MLPVCSTVIDQFRSITDGARILRLVVLKSSENITLWFQAARAGVVAFVAKSQNGLRDLFAVEGGFKPLNGAFFALIIEIHDVLLYPQK